ncbi:fimbria/pilus outer membrane usher protein [Vibrio astriarenae]
MRALFLLIMFLFSASCQGWELELPTQMDNAYIGDLIVQTDGTKIVGIIKTSLVDILTPYLTEQAISTLNTMPNILSLNSLDEIGIAIIFNPQRLDIELTVNNTLKKTHALYMGLDGIPKNYSSPTAWNLQNALNASSTTDNDSNHRHSIELNGGFNLGGVEGINGIYALYVDQSDNSTNVYRGSSYLFIDKPEKPWRLSLGDITSNYSGHLSSLNLGGVNWRSSYSELQPYKTLRTSASQTFELQQSAEVEIFVNNSRAARTNLPPGRYDLNNLPLTSGSNEIRLEVTYISGETETLFFTQFYNNELLKPGITEYSLSIGVASDFSQDQYSYDSDPVMTGYIEHGLNDSWTLGGNVLTHKEGQIAGLSVINGNRFGNIGLRLSSALYQNESEFDNGWAASIDYSQQVWGSSDYPNLRVSLETLNQFTSTPWYEESYVTEDSIRLDYTWNIWDGLDWSISSSWVERAALYIDMEGGRDVTIDSYLSLRFNSFYIQTGAIHQSSNQNKDETIGYINVDYYFNHLSSGHRLTTSYNSRNKSYRAEVSRNANDYVGEFGYSLSGEHYELYDRANARFNYNANRWRGELNGDWRSNTSGDNSWAGRATLSSSITVSEQGWGIHRSSIGPQAIVKAHPTLGSSAIEIGNGGAGNVQAIAYSNHSNIIRLTRAHDINAITYTSHDAPLGYDLGPGRVDIRPGSLTTHIIEVGSDASRTVIGTLLYPDGSPVSLFRGQITAPNGESKILFTNRAGRFALEGMSSGLYHIDINGYRGEITIADDAPILIYLQKPLTLSNKEEEI